jgi:hypothetical protein
MVILYGLDSKNYWQKPGTGSLPAVPCPSCPDTLLGPHGWYRRYLDGERVAFRRTICPTCGVTHALLPEDVCPYQDLTLPAVERALDAGTPTPAARAVGETTVATVRRARRWLRSCVWAMLRAAPSDLVDRIVELAGEAPGWLMRARHRLWSQLGVLLGGPCGLFRYGRPCLRLCNRGWQLVIGSGLVAPLMQRCRG